MVVFFQAAAGVLLAAILGLALSGHGKELGILLTLAVSVMVMIAAIRFLEPVMDFLQRLEELGQLDGELIRVLLKIAGIGLTSEIVGMVCTDAGNASLGKALQMLSAAVILWLSLPVFNALLELIRDVLGGI